MTRYSSSFAKLQPYLSSLCLLIFTTSSYANQLHIHVNNANNEKPLENAAVCIGVKNDRDLYGAMRTDDKGNVVFEQIFNNPQIPLVVTVSSSQYKGQQRTLIKNQLDQYRTIDLVPGGLGPVCDAPAKQIPITVQNQPRSLRVAGINLHKGQRVTHDRSVILTPKIIGKPSHYRISEDPKFTDSDWHEYQQTPLFTLSLGSGRKRIYYQVRKALEHKSGSSIQVLSNVASDSITLVSN